MLDAAGFAGLGAERLAACVAAGVDWVQVRERALPGARLVDLIDAISEAVRLGAAEAGRAAQVIVNKRIDAALACGAAGVHLGFDAVPPAVARGLLGEQRLLGVSCHTPQEATAAELADYVHLAPVFAPLSKPPSRPALGLAALAQATRGRRRVLAQGGVEASNAGECIAAGANGVAVTGTLLAARDPVAAASALRSALDSV